MADTLLAPAAQKTARLPLLDVLRGAAILGTLMTNVWIFTSPGSEWGVLQGGLELPDPIADPSAAHLAESVFRFLADGKFLALLTVLFGVGLAIQFDSAARRGDPWPGRYPRRAAFLFVEGTVHFVLVFAWDVLMGYAVTALLVAWLLARSEKVRRRAMWTAGGVHLALISLLTLDALSRPAGPRRARTRPPSSCTPTAAIPPRSPSAWNTSSRCASSRSSPSGCSCSSSSSEYGCTARARSPPPPKATASGPGWPSGAWVSGCR
ncbi:DUF418 domain-containing protein [Streptomyces virginiae]|uniref:DUF418 domain-containing protein n=1 Tax=Streptomyces virginiae TaxID=1961 RepID=UPI003664B5D1